MAFTPAEKSQILFYLGYSLFEDDGPAMRAINSLDSKETIAGPIIRPLLDKLNGLFDDIDQTRALSKAVRDGSIELRVHMTLDHLWRLGRSYVTMLARWCKISVGGDIFSTGTNARVPSEFYSGDPSENRIDPIMGVPTVK